MSAGNEGSSASSGGLAPSCGVVLSGSCMTLVIQRDWDSVVVEIVHECDPIEMKKALRIQGFLKG